MIVQKITVKDNVIDDDSNESLPSATLPIKGTFFSTSIDFDRNFTISRKMGDTSVVSYIGMKTQEFVV
tara:strand:- start:545 stop:748 length:204 start_codon:yes stop_codon:yes gene_type:complete